MMNSDAEISFFSEEVDMPVTLEFEARQWLIEVATNQGKKVGELSYVFCSDDYLLKINKEYLNHDYYTDVITFDYSEGDVVSGDIFISLAMIVYNAKKYLKSTENELCRVMAHGLLHLCGLKDKSELDAKKMRNAEDRALSLMGESNFTRVGG